MTIIVGIICKDAIVVATDSRTMDESGGRDDAIKSARIKFANGCGIVAVSGCADLGSLVVDQLEIDAPAVELRDYHSAPDAFSDALLKVKRAQAEREYCCAIEKLYEEQLVRGVKFGAMLAYYWKGEGYFYTAEIPGMGLRRRQFPHWALGCGRDVANYLLRGFDFPSMTSHQATLAAVNVIQEIKASDPRCGGPTQITLLGCNPEDKPEKLTAETIASMEKEVAAIAEAQKRERLALEAEIARAGNLAYQQGSGAGFAVVD